MAIVCVICNSNSFHEYLYIQTLHYDCSHIEDMHLSFSAHLIILSSFLTGVELLQFSFLYFQRYIMIVHTLNMCLPFLCKIDKHFLIFGAVELRYY